MRTSENIEGKKVVTTETCPKCGYVETDELDLTIKKEVPDPDYEKDKERFCLSGDRLKKNLEEKAHAETVKQFMEKIKEKDKHKEEYDRIKALKKLTIPQLKQCVVEALKDEAYSNLMFEQPRMEQIVSVGFTLEDPTSQHEYDSRKKLAKLLRTSLEETNWRLMSDGIDYRLGILSGRFRVYEKEEDLLSLVKQMNKKEPKSADAE